MATLVDGKKQMLLEEELAPSPRGAGMSKVEKYKWADTGEPGEFAWVKKTDLVIDNRYQRDADSETRVMKIASDFSWPVFGVLTVARRGAKLFTVDGQHRLLAALKRADVTKVPCMIFRSEGVADEADVFLRANGTRVGVNAIARFKAMLAKGDPTSKEVQKLLETAGRQAARNSGPTTVACIGLICAAHTKLPRELARVWPLLIALCRGAQMHERLVGGILYIEHALPEGTSLTDKRWSERLLRSGPENLLRSIDRFRVARGAHGAKVSAEGILQAVNRGLSDANKLRVVGDTAAG